MRLVTDPADVVAGVEGYAERYQQPKERDDRAVIEIDVDRILRAAADRGGVQLAARFQGRSARNR